MANKSTPTQKVYASLAAVEPMIKQIVLAGIWQMKEAAKDLSIIGFNETKKLIGRKGSYKLYRKKGKDRMSSQPGQPPAAELGQDLEPSIYQKVTSKSNQNPATAEFGSTAPFAANLEFGTTNLPARPFMLPARQKVANVAGSTVAQHLQIAYSRKTKSLKGIVIKMNMDI
jgi:hypothetical protein